MVGGGPINMLRVCEQVLVFPAMSVATHVRHRSIVFVAVMFVVVLRTVMPASAQLSVAAGVPKLQLVEDCTFCTVGVIVITGAMVSLTTMR
jgi:hypothetical protein